MFTAPTRHEATGTLLRVLGLGFGIAVLVGNTIGSGILRVPGEVAGHLPSVPLFAGIWIAGGLYALLGSNALAELAAMTQESGGYTVFVRRGLGPYVGFVAGWSDWLSTCTSATAAAIFLGEAAAALVGALPSRVPQIACALFVGLAGLQWRGVRTASGTQGFTTMIKAVALLAFIAVCFHARPAPQHPIPLKPSGVPLLVALVLSMQAVIFTCDGWIGPAYFAGEVRDPGRDLPRSIFSGVAVVIAIYLLFNAALLHVLGIGALAHDPFPAATVAGAVLGPAGDTVLRLLVILSLLSAINAFLMMTSRTFYAVSAANGVRAGTRVNEGGTPTIGLIISAAVCALFLIGGSYARVIAITAFLFVANYTFLFLSLFVLRRREPDTPRPYVAWGHPWSTGAVLLVSLGLLGAALAADTWNSVASVVLLLISYPVFKFIRREPS